jgi:hypothetical protein
MVVPRYCFHLGCEDITVPDHSGANLRDADQVRRLHEALGVIS